MSYLNMFCVIVMTLINQTTFFKSSDVLRNGLYCLHNYLNKHLIIHLIELNSVILCVNEWSDIVLNLHRL